MNIQQLKSRNIKKQIKKQYEYLGIYEIFSSHDEKIISQKFIETGIWHYENRAIASFEFHKNGIIDHQLVEIQHQKAREVFREQLFRLKCDKLYVLIEENGVFCWVLVDFLLLCEHFDRFLTQNGDFLAFVEDDFALAIYPAEYEWELLIRKMN